MKSLAVALTLFVFSTPALGQPQPAPTAPKVPVPGERPASVVTLSENDRQASGIRVQPARRQDFSKLLTLTGKVSLNQDRIAHVYSMVEGTVDSVSVTLGQRVEANDLLAVIHSREVGAAKLELYQARLQLELKNTQNRLQQDIAANTGELLVELRKGTSIAEIERRFRDRPMGDYRERALASYSAFLKSDADVRRLQEVTQSGAVSGKQLLAATANRNADQATFQSRIEQIQYELQTSTLMASQAVKEAEAKVLVAATSLKILDVGETEINEIDPANQGEKISHYPVRAPLDGTVLTKDVVLREQVRSDVMLLSIADLSTVWITADVYEEHLPVLDSLKGTSVTVHSDVLPDRTFTAKVFYTGDIMDEATRTISLQAIAENADRQLKPGMFVHIEVPLRQDSQPIVLPDSAIQDYKGEKFVFVDQGNGDFHRRDVKLGASNGPTVVVRQGVDEGESIVVGGGFILKSQLLAELLGDE